MEPYGTEERRGEGGVRGRERERERAKERFEGRVDVVREEGGREENKTVRSHASGHRGR